MNFDAATAAVVVAAAGSGGDRSEPVLPGGRLRSEVAPFRPGMIGVSEKQRLVSLLRGLGFRPPSAFASHRREEELARELARMREEVKERWEQLRRGGLLATMDEVVARERACVRACERASEPV